MYPCGCVCSGQACVFLANLARMSLLNEPSLIEPIDCSSGKNCHPG